VGGRVEHGPAGMGHGGPYRRQVLRTLDEGAFVAVAAAVLAMAAIVRLVRVFTGPHDG